MFVCPACGASAPGPGFCSECGTPLADAHDDPLLGTTVGAYRLACRLGKGGMGTVYLGVHPSIGSRVAIKVLLEVAAESQQLVDRFFAEAKSVNLIRHESIVNVLDLSVLPDGRPYIVMEHLDGQPLSRCFAAWKPFPLDLLVRLMLEVLGALEAAHAQGIVHRDLKPDNVFVTTLGRAKVLDFGVAKLHPDHARHQQTRTGALLGTPHYMSPEQVRGEPADPRSDLYSLGVILFEGATGQLPFDAPALYDIFKKHMTELPPQPSALRGDIPLRLEQVIGRALAKQREDRFQSAREFADTLLPIVRELPESGSLPPLAQVTAAPSFVTGPTMDAVASTMPAQAAPVVRSAGVALGAAFGLGAIVIALGALGVAGVGAYFAFVRSSRGAPAPASVSSTAPGKPNRFDPWDYLPKAQERARKKFPDAELYLMMVNGSDRDGLISFDAMMHAVTYNFRSPSASQSSKKCLVTVGFGLNGTFESVMDSSDCKEQPITKLRCSVRQISAKSPPGEFISISVQMRNEVPKWSVTLSNGTMLQLADDC